MKGFINILAVVAIAVVGGYLAGYWYESQQTPDLRGGVYQPIQGGTGTSTTDGAGAVLIYNNTTGLYEPSTLTQGSNMTITNADGSITLASSGGGAGTGSNWGYDTNFAEDVITPTTTIPIWLQDSLYASSTAFFSGLATFDNIVVSTTTATSTFAGGLAIETSGLVYDYSSNNVGIGTAAPISPLHLQDSDSSITWTPPAGTALVFESNNANPAMVIAGPANSDSLRLLFATPTNINEGTIGYSNNNDFMWFETNDDEQMRILSSGNLGIGTTSPLHKLSVEGGVYILGNSTTTDIFVADGEFRFQSVTKTQTLTATSQILSTTTVLNIDSASDIVMTGIPLVATSTNGALLILRNVGDFVIDLQDNAVAGSGIYHGGTTCVVNPRDEVTMLFQSDADGSGNAGWVVQSHPNLQAGGDATILNVRNVSGSSIAAGKAVYGAGWNAGLDRATIELADADAIAPANSAIGITFQAIANGANGQIVKSGELVDAINTSGASVGDGVWLSTTAGEVVFTRPAVDDIQRLGTVLRSHASQGVVLITGAGRVNDTPHNVIFTTSTTTNATTTNLHISSNFNFGGDVFTDLTGTGLTLSSGTLVPNLTGGTGITFSNPTISIDFTEFDTDDITEGSTNFWSDQARWDSFWNATTTLSSVTTLLNLTDLISTNATTTNATTTTLAISALTNCDTIDTDANGVLSCGSDATGTGVWEQFNGMGIRTATANDVVVIGATATTTSSVDLEVEGDVAFGRRIIHDGDPDTYLQLVTDSVSFTGGGWIGFSVDDDEFKINVTADSNKIFQWKGTSISDLIYSNSSLNTVGIGTTTANSLLTVDGTFAVGTNGNEFTVDASGTLTSLSTATSTLAGGLDVLYLNQTGASATSTFATGIDLTNGCFAINGTCVAGAGDPDQNLWLTIAGDTGSTAANITTDTLTFTGGTGNTTAMSGDALTVSFDCSEVEGTGINCVGEAITLDLSGSVLNDLSQTSLADPGADQIVFWDDSDTQFEFLTMQGLSISANTLSVNATTSLDQLITVGALGSGSITANFGNIDIGSSDFDADGTITSTGVINFGGATSFELPNNGTVNANGEITTDDTSGQLRYYAGSAERVIVPFYTTGFNYGSTTQGSGTTTRYMAPAEEALTMVSARCDFSNFMGVSLYDGTNRADYFEASSTIGQITFTTNNTFTAGEAIRVDIGTSTDIAAQVDGGCRFRYTYQSD